MRDHRCTPSIGSIGTTSAHHCARPDGACSRTIATNACPRAEYRSADSTFPHASYVDKITRISSLPWPPLWHRPAMLQHAPGLTASPPLRYTLKWEAADAFPVLARSLQTTFPKYHSPPAVARAERKVFARSDRNASPGWPRSPTATRPMAIRQTLTWIRLHSLASAARRRGQPLRASPSRLSRAWCRRCCKAWSSGASTRSAS